MGQAQRVVRNSARQKSAELWEINREVDRGKGRKKRPEPYREEKELDVLLAGDMSRAGRPVRHNLPPANRARSVRHNPPAANRARPVRHNPPAANRARPIRHNPPVANRARPARHNPPAAYRTKPVRSSPPDMYGRGKPCLRQSAGRRRARRKRAYLCKAAEVLFIVLCLVLIYQTMGAVGRLMHQEAWRKGKERDNDHEIVSILSDNVNEKQITPPAILEEYLDINEYSRPGTGLETVRSVFVHYTANPGTTAEQNRSYFANLAVTHERSASAHFIIGYEGELVQCIPLDEQAYAVATRNGDSVSIECCYLAEDGSFTQETYDTLIHTLAWLLEEYDLTTEDILRHYDCGGKKCPLYYVDHEKAWEKLLRDVEAYKEL